MQWHASQAFQVQQLLRGPGVEEFGAFNGLLYQACLAFRESEMDAWLSSKAHTYRTFDWQALQENKGPGNMSISYVTFPLICSFSSVLERARHCIERTLELDAHEEPDNVCQKASKMLPRLVHCRLDVRPA